MAVGVLAMCNRLLCRFNWIPKSFPRSTLTHSMRQFHRSPIVNSRLEDFGKLIDQGKKSISKLKSKDNVPPDYHLIYKATWELTFRLGYPVLISLGAGLMGLVVYRHYNKDKLEMGKPIGKGIVKFRYPEQELWVFSLALISLVIAGSSLMLKYPFRIYKHASKKEYIGVYLNPFLPILRQVHFTSANPTKFRNPFYALVQDCHYVLSGNRKTFFFSYFFRVPKDLTDMCHESKPTKG